MQLFEVFKNHPLYQHILGLKEKGKLPHALMFLSIDEVTNCDFCQCLAGGLICDNSDDFAKIKSKTHPDVFYYPKAKQNISVIDIEDIYNNFQTKPMIAKQKVFILNNFDLATEQAQNKLLKILEEPTKNVTFLLNATNENKILPTILSRVQQHYISKFDKDKTLELMNEMLIKSTIEYENTSFDEKDISIENLYNVSNGYIGDILKIACNKEYLNNYKFVQKFINECKNSVQVIDYISYFDKNNFLNILMIMSNAYRDLMIALVNGTSTNDYSISALVKIIKLLNEYKKLYESNVSISAMTENLLLKIMEIKNLCK